MRLAGFAAALKTGFAERLVLAGGDEARYKDESEPVNRAETIRKMLVEDYGIEAERIIAFASRSNTLGNVAIVKKYLEDHRLDPSQCGLVTNLYHLPRASMDLDANGVHLRLFAAEALWMIAGGTKNDITRELGEGPLAERVAEEIAGIADKIRGTYLPRTDTDIRLPSFTTCRS